MVENERKDDNTGDSGGKSPKKLRVLLRTFGCQMNVRDSEVISGLLKKAGFDIIDTPEKADIVIFNTCSVRQHAEDKVWSEIGRFKRKERNTKIVRQRIIGLVGCMAKNYKEDIFERAPNVDFAVGPSDIHKIPDIVNKFARQRNNEAASKRNLFDLKIWETDGLLRPEEIYHSGEYRDKNHAYVVISEGCSNFCSYCVVPYVRGELRHRKHKDIILEVKEAINKGIKKFTLLGQNVNAYRDEDVDFIKLLCLINALDGLKEISFITSHPKDTSVELFKAMNDLDKVKKYLHLPVQSGSDKILRLMNRGYTRKFYLGLAEKYRKIVKDGMLTTDVIVGFPGEGKEDFEDTRKLLEKIRFNSAYIFKYSVRPHSRACQMPDNVSREEKEKRHKVILELQKRISKDVE